MAPVGEGVLPVLLVAGSPEPSSPELVALLARRAGFVIAVDGGAEACAAAGVLPDMFCGDADSASPGAAAWARAVAHAEAVYPSEKDDTDLSLALACARSEAARRGAAPALTITCASGGRPDHALGVFGVLAANSDASPVLAEDGFECRLLSPSGTPSWELGPAAVGSTFSAIPLACGTVVSEGGMRWELDHEPIAVLSDRGVSNVVTSERARVTCEAGTLAAFLLA